MEKYDVFPTVAWSAGPGCHGGCGQKLYVKDGRVLKVEGDEDHPFNQGRSCPRVLALTQYMYHPDRITRPLKRVGARGEGKFEPITWDEAYDLCERRLNEIREKYGPESVVFAQGTGRDIGGTHLVPGLQLRQPQLGAARPHGSILLHPKTRRHALGHGRFRGHGLLSVPGKEI